MVLSMLAAEPSGLVDSFLAAIQASLSVLLVIFYGGIAVRLKLLDTASTKAISKICVRMFLPALLITDIGSQLHAGSAHRYVIVLIWAIVCHLISFLVGILGHLLLGMPDWTTVAIMFNNTTSYPLLLIAALDETGILQSLLGADETTSEAIKRAKSYFLVFATVSSCLTFAVGPRLIDTEHAPELNEEDKSNIDTQPDLDQEPNEQSALLPGANSSSTAIQFVEDPFGHRRNSFFPSTRPLPAPSQQQADAHLRRTSIYVPKKHWVRLSPRVKWWLLLFSDFFNAPLVGAIIGAIIGLTPALHRAFFNDTADGGIFTAWLTASLKSIGGLFVPLPVVVAGVSLYTSILDTSKKQKQASTEQSARNEAEDDAGQVQAKQGLPWGTVSFILIIRFVIWPVVSIATIYALASRTTLLGSDPMLWFTLMLMPTGPPAMKLITLIQVSDADEDDEASIAKLLTVSSFILYLSQVEDIY
jgi:predicted permease